MRIVGYIENDACKVTVFHQGLRFMVKFEDGLYEQAFKFRESDKIKGLNDIQKLIDQRFIDEVMYRFSEMRQSTGNLLNRYIGEQAAFEDEEII
jgi:hypothetical protein